MPGTCVEIKQCSGAPDNSSLSHFSAMTWPRWLRRAVRSRHRHAIEQVSRRWRGGQRCDSGRTRRRFDFHTTGYQTAPKKSWPKINSTMTAPKLNKSARAPS